MTESSNNNLDQLLRTNVLYCTNCLDGLGEIPDKSIDCVITSPPYWQQRNYSAQGQMGQEPTIEEYCNNLYHVFDEIGRVLKDSGTCWVNIGDKYQNQGLLGIPARFELGMRNRGWILINRIVWKKTNAKPESVKRRFTQDHEYMFFFVKTKDYYFHQQFEPCKSKPPASRPSSLHRGMQHKLVHPGGQEQHYGRNIHYGKMRNVRDTWSISLVPSSGPHVAPYPEELILRPILAGCPPNGIVLDPFSGSGTTAVVAMQQGRRFIGFEINSEYVAYSYRRLLDHIRDHDNPLQARRWLFDLAGPVSAPETLLRLRVSDIDWIKRIMSATA